MEHRNIPIFTGCATSFLWIWMIFYYLFIWSFNLVLIVFLHLSVPTGIGTIKKTFHEVYSDLKTKKKTSFSEKQTKIVFIIHWYSCHPSKLASSPHLCPELKNVNVHFWFWLCLNDLKTLFDSEVICADVSFKLINAVHRDNVVLTLKDCMSCYFCEFITWKCK